MGRSTYLRLESGERVADVSQIAQICEVMGIDFMTLMSRAGERVSDFEGGDDLAARRERRAIPGLSVAPSTVEYEEQERAALGHDVEAEIEAQQDQP